MFHKIRKAAAAEYAESLISQQLVLSHRVVRVPDPIPVPELAAPRHQFRQRAPVDDALSDGLILGRLRKAGIRRLHGENRRMPLLFKPHRESESRVVRGYGDKFHSFLWGVWLGITSPSTPVARLSAGAAQTHRISCPVYSG